MLGASSVEVARNWFARLFGFKPAVKPPVRIKAQISPLMFVPVGECPACGGSHIVTMMPFTHPVVWDGDVAKAAGQCPVTGELIHETWNGRES